jgi:pimeloyl-ACP methyl ester carboxylesterase
MRCLLGVAVGVFFFGLGLTPFGPCAGAETVAGDGTDASSSRQPLQWAACPDIPDMECSGLDVPVDPARPDGLRFTLRLGRLPVLDPRQRKGALLFIPGGPGAGIAKIIGGDNGTAQHVDEFRRQWDVVSFDPRGIERSSPIRCSPDRAAFAAPSKPPYHLAARR